MNVMKVIADQKRMVGEFMTAMGQNPTVELQLSLVIEEAKELLQAADAFSDDPSLVNMESFLKEAADLNYVMIGAIVAAERAEEAGEDTSPPNAAEATILVSVSEVLLGHASQVFLDDDLMIEAFQRVHASNLSKLGEDGKPIFSDDGKVLKGPNYQKPNLTDLAVIALERFLIWEASFDDVTDEDEWYGVAA